MKKPHTDKFAEDRKWCLCKSDEALRILHARSLAWTTSEPVVPACQCKTRGACEGVMNSVKNLMEMRAENRGLDPLDIESWPRLLCEYCFREVRIAAKRCLEIIWDELPGFLDMGDWGMVFTMQAEVGGLRVTEMYRVPLTKCYR